MIVGGCKSKKGSADAIADAAVSISKKDYGDIGALLKVPTRDVSQDDAEAALKAAGLWEENKFLTWDSRSGDAGTYIFKNISGTGDDGETLTAKTLTLAGLHMVGDTPFADLVDLGGVSLKDDETSLTIKNLGLTGVTLSKNLTDLGQIEDILDTDANAKGPTSFVMSGLKGKSDDAVFEIERLGWGQDPQDKRLRFAAEDISLTGVGNEAFTVKLDSANIRGLEGLEGLEESGLNSLEGLAGGNGFMELLSQNSSLGDVDVKGLDISSDVFSLALPKLNQSTRENGDLMKIDFDMPSMTISVKEKDNLPPDALRAMAMLKSLGFSELEFSSKGQTEINKDTDLMTIKAVSLDLKDGFDLNYKGGISGFGAMQKLGTGASQADIKAAQENLTIHDFALSLEDKSIVDRGFKLAGEMTGQEPDNLRRQINGVLALGSLAALTQSDGAIYSEFTKALGEFLQDGGTLNIELNPEEPLKISDFEALSQGQKPDLKRLGFSASTTQ